jgi:hypothetical protein
MSRTEPRAAFTPAQHVLASDSSSVDGASGSLDTPRTRRRQARIDLPLLVGLAAVAFTAVYLISDLIEVAQGGFSTFRLFLTYAGEAAIPLFVIGLYAVQRPRIGRLGFLGAIAYAYSYVFFTSTVVYALISGIPNYKALVKVFGAWMTVHGLILLVGGLTFGLAVVRAKVLPRWTGVCLMAGVVLVAAASGLSDVARTVAAAVPAIAFIGMGIALLRSVISSAPEPLPRHRPNLAPRLGACYAPRDGLLRTGGSGEQQRRCTVPDGNPSAQTYRAASRKPRLIRTTSGRAEPAF